ncbi:succinylglutamate desuccinylase/aspartoacylase family protein [Compostimonas suwonensis]|uniref:N-alpha-acetyl-L-2,4-diaminobutyrate deacetylase n=1 Tax=Compostimonas suwonensis TaxID=1048394 RepID=A0A2M9C3Q4_9MICO|nr:succinylglutamate desuccinylase/aspartoacylase family protein [Compostimonas suwonensis]PJJ65097.1 N-alpha-acetyl-L-2,4-diaminobutyrate deacetylase [Compostimonas suwonensis]
MFDIASGFDGAAGTRETLSLVAGELPTGEPYLIPVMVINGSTGGPTLLVHTGMHGDEVLGAEVVRAVWLGLGPDDIRGRLIMVPSSNLPAMATRTRTNLSEIYPGPHDLNRVFPGDAAGSLSERVARIITDQLLAVSDYCLDIHTPSVGGEWMPYASAPAPGSVDADYGQRSHAFARAFGTTLVYAGDLFAGTIQDTARTLGKVVTTVEFGEANRFDPALMEWGVQGVRNLLIHLGMTEGSLVAPDAVRTFSRLHRLRADRGGFLRVAVRPGDDVIAGQRLASVGNVLGAELEVITAPESGRVVRVNNNALAGTGDLVVYLGADS